MYLSSVHVKGFRNLSDITVNFRPGLNVIVGENNVGKTNLFDAIRIALGGSAFDGFPLRAKASDLHRDTTGAVAGAFEVHLTFADVSQDDMSAFIECLVYDAQNPTASVLQVHYRWSWNADTERYTDLRWGGASEDQLIRSDVLQAFPATYLEPLRDALAQLVGGRASKISQLLVRLSDPAERAMLEALFTSTNAQLRDQPLIGRTVAAIAKNLHDAMGPALAQNVGLAPAAPSFSSIAQSIRMVLQLPLTGEQPQVNDAELYENGLGYNNLLFIATVLAYRTAVQPGDVPLLFVEEPEAHLHPQLQTLLVDYLNAAANPSNDESEKTVGATKKDGQTKSGKTSQPPQVFVTTHSPVLAAHVPPDHLIVMHTPVSAPTAVRAVSLWQLGLTDDEVRRLHRLLDVTKSTLLFSRGIIFVEGISEQLIMPELARRIGKNLGHAAVSVIALHGLGFDAIAKLFGDQGIEVRCAIVTDADPPFEEGVSTIEGDAVAHWKATPRLGEESGALKALRERISGTPTTRVFVSRVTLEYDLAAGASNAQMIVGMWPSVRGVQPRKFTSAAVAALPNDEERARLCWQAICLQDEGRHKAAFAHELANRLADPKVAFTIPSYLHEAIKFVLPDIPTTTKDPTDGTPQHA